MRLIDADDFIARLDHVPMVKDAIKKAMDHMPTIEPKKGKWLCSDDMYESGICSICKWDTGEPYDNCKKWFKFCPNCGSYNGGDEA